VARAAVEQLNQDFDPATDDLLPSLELVLRRLKGVVIPPGSWDPERIPDHLKPCFEVLGERNKMLGSGRDLAALQGRFASENRRAIAASLGTSPDKLTAAGGGKMPDGGGKQRSHGANGAGTAGAGNAASGMGNKARPKAGKQATSPWQRTGLKDWPDDLGEHGALPDQVTTTVKGQQITAHPGLVDRGDHVDLTVYRNKAEREAGHRRGVIRLLWLMVPSPQRYVLDHLNNKEKLAFSQSPHGTVDSLIKDCTWAGIDKLVPPALPMSKGEYTKLFQHVRAELIDTVFTVSSTVEKILSGWTRITARLDRTRSGAMKDTVEDVRSQLRGLVYKGFVAGTGYQHLAHVPRYLMAVERRLDKAEAGAVTKDLQGTDTIQELEDAYDDVLERVPGGAVPAALRKVKWLLEEERVSLFAQELGTAVSVSPKRIRAAIKQAAG
jgi:ATP-dependent helicase HrpA